MSNPGLLTVGQFVFSQDRRIVVNTAPATQQWSLTIMVWPQNNTNRIWYSMGFIFYFRRLLLRTLAGMNAR